MERDKNKMNNGSDLTPEECEAIRFLYDSFCQNRGFNPNKPWEWSSQSKEDVQCHLEEELLQREENLPPPTED